MTPVVYTLADAKSYYENGYEGEIRCVFNKTESIADSYEDAKIIYKEEQNDE
jgi:hypothetical protein